MKMKKSVVIFLIAAAIILTIGGLAYNQVVTEQIPVSSDDHATTNSGDASGIKIENEPLTIKDQSKF